MANDSDSRVGMVRDLAPALSSSRPRHARRPSLQAARNWNGLFHTRLPRAAAHKKMRLPGTGDPSPPYIRVEISSFPGEIIAPVSLSLIQMRRDPRRSGRIARAELVESIRNPLWLSGTITLHEAVPGRQVSGHYNFTAPAGGQLDSSFIAEYSNQTAACG
jgi:hypothetical protein